MKIDFAKLRPFLIVRTKIGYIVWSANPNRNDHFAPYVGVRCVVDDFGNLVKAQGAK